MISPIQQATSLEEFLAACKVRVEVLLRDLIGAADDSKLAEAMAYATLNGGKRVRPVLVYGAARAMGADPARADGAACAVELIHCYSLVHDDLPAMDDDDLRRGLPTVHRAFDVATAILVGDALQSLAFEAITRSAESGVAPAACLRMTRVLAAAAGHQGMVQGQVRDFEAVGRSLTLPALEAMHRLKTGMLINASVELGALCATDPDEPQMTALRSYASCVGLAFQIQDDILDETADSAQSGKARGADRALNKPTYVSLLGLDAARERARELTGEAVGALEDFGPQADRLRELARYIVNRTH